MNDKDTNYPCPLCGQPMTVYPDAPVEKSGSRSSRIYGVRLQCDNPCVSYCHESVFGHGANAKEAHAAAKEKYRPVKE